MTARTIAEAFADAAARLTGEPDVVGSLVALLADCVALIDGESAGLLIEVPGDGLALLASTSHTATVLELYELQNNQGPCIEAIRDNDTVTATVPALSGQWVPVGQAITDAGYHGVHAFPLRFGNQAVGALNLFTTDTGVLDDEQQRLGQAFANMAVAVVAHPPTVDPYVMRRHVTDVLADRITIEQAKGVLAVRHDINLSDAYTLLISTAADQHLAVVRYAAQVVASVGPNSRVT
jgi:transcriptional regulator with GAF, ATPase, and Fis domain